jgi:hypothetical protein
VGFLIALLCVAIVLYSQTTILDWDEGFHLVAAALIAAGKRPYLDFLFPQPWLHAAWNALWVEIGGGGWRLPHVVAALETCGAVLLTARFSVTAALLVALNPLVVQWGTTAQPYGACLLLTTAALTAITARRNMLAGTLAGLAACCSLLSAPVAPVLIVYRLARREWRDALRTAAGTALGIAPILYAFLRAPSLTWFNLVEYHAVFRRAGWEDITASDFAVYSSVFHSWQALVLIGFAIFGIRRAPLPAAIAAALAIEAAIAHPTFPQYFILVVPFLAIVASPPRETVIPLTALLAITCTMSLLEARRVNNSWTNMEAIARKIAEVTPGNASILADPPVYFALHRQPPSGMEFPASHDIEFLPNRAAALHIVSWQALAERLRSGEFATAETCKPEQDKIDRNIFAHETRIAGCEIYWEVRGK